jgi:hypothetical protein
MWAAVTRNKEINAASADESFGAAWEKHHDSFADNQDDVVQSLHSATMKDLEYISWGNIDSTMQAMKNLDKPELAKEILDAYMKQHAHKDRKFFDLSDPIWGPSRLEGDLGKAFREKYESLRPAPDALELFTLEQIALSWKRVATQLNA